MLIAFLLTLGVPLYHVVTRAFSYSVKFSCIISNQFFKFSFPPSRSLVSDPQSSSFFHRPGYNASFVSVLTFALFHLVS